MSQVLPPRFIATTTGLPLPVTKAASVDLSVLRHAEFFPVSDVQTQAVRLSPLPANWRDVLTNKIEFDHADDSNLSKRSFIKMMESPHFKDSQKAILLGLLPGVGPAQTHQNAPHTSLPNLTKEDLQAIRNGYYDIARSTSNSTSIPEQLELLNANYISRLPISIDRDFPLEEFEFVLEQLKALSQPILDTFLYSRIKAWSIDMKLVLLDQISMAMDARHRSPDDSENCFFTHAQSKVDEIEKLQKLLFEYLIELLPIDPDRLGADPFVGLDFFQIAMAARQRPKNRFWADDVYKIESLSPIQIHRELKSARRPGNFNSVLRKKLIEDTAAILGLPHHDPICLEDSFQDLTLLEKVGDWYADRLTLESIKRAHEQVEKRFVHVLNEWAVSGKKIPETWLEKWEGYLAQRNSDSSALMANIARDFPRLSAHLIEHEDRLVSYPHIWRRLIEEKFKDSKIFKTSAALVIDFCNGQTRLFDNSADHLAVSEDQNVYTSFPGLWPKAATNAYLAHPRPSADFIRALLTAQFFGLDVKTPIEASLPVAAQNPELKYFGIVMGLFFQNPWDLKKALADPKGFWADVKRLEDPKLQALYLESVGLFPEGSARKEAFGAMMLLERLKKKYTEACLTPKFSYSAFTPQPVDQEVQVAKILSEFTRFSYMDIAYNLAEMERLYPGRQSVLPANQHALHIQVNIPDSMTLRIRDHFDKTGIGYFYSDLSLNPWVKEAYPDSKPTPVSLSPGAFPMSITIYGISSDYLKQYGAPLLPGRKLVRFVQDGKTFTCHYEGNNRTPQNQNLIPVSTDYLNPKLAQHFPQDPKSIMDTSQAMTEYFESGLTEDTNTKDLTEVFAVISSRFYVDPQIETDALNREFKATFDPLAPDAELTYWRHLHDPRRVPQGFVGVGTEEDLTFVVSTLLRARKISTVYATVHDIDTTDGQIIKTFRHPLVVMQDETTGMVHLQYIELPVNGEPRLSPKTSATSVSSQNKNGKEKSSQQKMLHTSGCALLLSAALGGGIFLGMNDSISQIAQDLLPYLTPSAWDADRVLVQPHTHDLGSGEQGLYEIKVSQGADLPPMVVERVQLDFIGHVPIMGEEKQRLLGAPEENANASLTIARNSILPSLFFSPARVQPVGGNRETAGWFGSARYQIAERNGDVEEAALRFDINSQSDESRFLKNQVSQTQLESALADLDLSPEASTWDKIQAVQQHIAEDYIYVTQPGRDPLQQAFVANWNDTRPGAYDEYWQHIHNPDRQVKQLSPVQCPEFSLVAHEMLVTLGVPTVYLTGYLVDNSDDTTGVSTEAHLNVGVVLPDENGVDRVYFVSTKPDVFYETRPSQITESKDLLANRLSPWVVGLSLAGLGGLALRAWRKRGFSQPTVEKIMDKAELKARLAVAKESLESREYAMNLSGFELPLRLSPETLAEIRDVLLYMNLTKQNPQFFSFLEYKENKAKRSALYTCDKGNDLEAIDIMLAARFPQSVSFKSPNFSIERLQKAIDKERVNTIVFLRNKLNELAGSVSPETLEVLASVLDQASQGRTVVTVLNRSHSQTQT